MMNTIIQSSMKRHIVCLCGSTRFYEEYRLAYFSRTVLGQIVLSVGFYANNRQEHLFLRENVAFAQKEELDLLHFDKIWLANESYILNVDGYIGPSTMREIACTVAAGKELTFFEPKSGNNFLEKNSHKLGAMVAEFLNDKIPALPTL